MKLAYSALRVNKNSKQKPATKELEQRYQGYLSACTKYRSEIAAIQKYLPGWMPAFEWKAES